MTRFDEFARKMRSVAERASRLDADVRELLAYLDDLKEGEGKVKEKRDWFKRQVELQLEAARGVKKVEITRLPDSSAVVRIGEHSTMILTKTLSDFLSVLCLDLGSSPDHLVDWKTPEELVRQLMKLSPTGRVSRASVIQNIHRLKNALIESGGNPYLVVGARSKGYRFAVWHKQGPVIPWHP